MNVWVFSAVALALAASIHVITDHQNKIRALNGQERIHITPSTNMAIIVDAVAMVYLLYITYDEYTGKPLGLRPAKAKMRLIFLDLFFIVFDSANLSLAFVSIEKVNCDDEICSRQSLSLCTSDCVGFMAHNLFHQCHELSLFTNIGEHLARY